MSTTIPGNALRLATMVGTFGDGTQFVIERYEKHRPYPGSPHQHWVRRTRYENGKRAARSVSQYTGRNVEQLTDTWAAWEAEISALRSQVA